ncbi:MAG: adenylate/guanylate cyclase domain-containing protein [Roseibium sp.]
MFLDISDFSARPSVTQEQQQNILETLALFFTEMIRVIEDYGGVVEKNTGDGLMAYFVRGAGSEHSAQQQSVSAALTMFDIAGRVINPILERSGLQPVSFRITMDHGPITIARVGAAQRFNGIVAIGSTANIASKMLAFASPDTILIGEGVLGGLPDARRQIFVRLQTRDTGWVRVADGNPYGFFQYTGRWLEPTT